MLATVWVVGGLKVTTAKNVNVPIVPIFKVALITSQEKKMMET